MDKIKKCTWWKLILVQLLGIGLFLLMAELGIGQPFASIVGPKNERTMDFILFFSIFGPVIFGWYRKVDKWWLSALIVILLFFFMICFYVIKMYELNKLVPWLRR